MAQQDDYSETLAKIIQQYQELGRLLPEQQIQQATLASGFPKVVQGMLGVAQATGAVTKGMLESAKAIHDGTKGMKAFDGALDGASKGLMILAGALAALAGPIGIITGAIVAGIGAYTKLAKMANEQSDKLYEAFQQMSRSGGAAADGLSGLYKDVQRLGGGIQDLGDFVSLVTSNAGEFALFAGSVFEGRKEFARLSKEMEPFRASLMNAGMTQKEINEATAGYIKLQSRIGMTQNRTTAELQESTRKYLLEQDALTKLLGMTRKEQEDAREALRNREIFAAKTLAMRNAGQEAAAGQLEKTFLLLSKDSKEVGDGFADIVSGNLRTEAAQKLMRATQGEAMQIQQELSDGTITAAQGADRMAMALKRSLDMFGETQGVLGNFNTTFTDIAGAIRVTSRLLTGGYERQEQIIERNAKRQGIFGDAMDKELERQTSLRLTQVSAMQSMQDFLRYGIKPATKSTEFFGKVIEYVAKLLPGSTDTKKQYEAEKKAAAVLADREVELSKAMQKVLEAQAAADEATTPDAVTETKRELEKAKNEARAAKDAKDAAELKYQRIQAGITNDDGPRTFDQQTAPGRAAAEAQQELDTAIAAVVRAYDDSTMSDEDRKKIQQEEQAARIRRDQAVREVELENRRRRMAGGRDTRSVGEQLANPRTTGTAGAAAPAAAPATPAAAPATPAPATPAPATPAPATPAPASATGRRSNRDPATGRPVPGSSPPASNPTDQRLQQGTQTAPMGDRSQNGTTGDQLVQMGDDVRIGNQIRRGGTISWRTNNPGNVSWSGIARDFGAIGTWKNLRGDRQQQTTGIAIMPTEQDGDRLKEALWRRPMYADKTIDEAIQQWAEGAKKQGYGSNYARDMAQAAGATLDTIVGSLSSEQLQAMLKKQRQWEGWKEGQVLAAAEGGIVREKLGGTLIRAGEAGQDEAIIPLKNGAVPVMMSGNEEMVDAIKSMLSEFKSAMQNMMNSMQTNEIDLVRVLQQIESANRGANDSLNQLVRFAQN